MGQYIFKMMVRRIKNRIVPASNIPIHIVSFPKCGRTWLRLMLGKIFQGHFKLGELDVDDLLEVQTFSRKNPNIPKIVFTHNEAGWKKPGELEFNGHIYENAKVILLVRDPRDVIVSYYFQKNRRWAVKTVTQKKQAYQGSLNSFIREETGGFDTLLRFYEIWQKNRWRAYDFLLLRYEDLHKDANQELIRVLNFMGISGVDNAIIKEAVEVAAFNNMRKIEENAEAEKSGLRRLNPADPQDQESFKTRKGVVGGYKDYLSSEEIDFLNRKMKASLSSFYNYTPSKKNSFSFLKALGK
jgi:hypothetical protein